MAQVKNLLLKMNVGGALNDIFVFTKAKNVFIDEDRTETLATRLTKIADEIAEVSTNSSSPEEVNNIVTQAVTEVKEQLKAEILGGAPAEAWDTIKEISDWLVTNNDISTKLDTVISTHSKDIADLGSKVQALEAKSTNVKASETNGYIKVDDVDVKVYEHPTGDGYTHIPAGGSAGQMLAFANTGAAKWLDSVVVGSDAELTNLETGQLLFYVLDDGSTDDEPEGTTTEEDTV